MYGIRSQIIQRLVKLLFFFQGGLLVANVNREATSVLVMAFRFIGKTLRPRYEEVPLRCKENRYN